MMLALYIIIGSVGRRDVVSVIVVLGETNFVRGGLIEGAVARRFLSNCFEAILRVDADFEIGW